MPNRLIHEKSPYLLQHAHNPVDWYPWGEEAFAKARAEGKPIFLSIGYSTCHWCHVMERESFENDSVATLLNDFFVPIKVDREERPDVDRIYMSAVQAMSGQGGWPLNVFLTPALEPFFGGTYFPPAARMGRIGMMELLPRVHGAWQEQRSEIEESGRQIVAAIEAVNRPETGSSAERTTMFDAAYAYLERAYDEVRGGFGGAPKFPSPANLHFLFRYWSADPEPRAKAREMALRQLDAMEAGGIHDHLGGGFHRYAVDAEWLVSHFEKMLYDQAQLAWSYLEAFQITGERRYARTARGIFDYVSRDLTSPHGAFYSAEDADSEGEEGKFYVWTPADTQRVLGDGAALFDHYYGVTAAGNFEHGTSVLSRVHAIEEAAALAGISVDTAEKALAEARAKMLTARSERVRPHLDDKVLTSWNGLMISAFARGARVLSEPEFAEAAERAATFIWDTMYDEDSGDLLRRFRDGEAAMAGQLDDYAYLVLGLTDLYQATLDVKWLERAALVTDAQIARFWDDADGGFFESPAGDASVKVRMKDGFDGAELAGNSVAAYNLQNLGALLDRTEWLTKAQRAFDYFTTRLARGPAAMPQMLAAMGLAEATARHVVIAGTPGADDTKAMLAAFNRRFLPHDALLFVGVGEKDGRLASLVPFTENLSGEGGRATAYVCVNYACRLPATDAETFAAQLDERPRVTTTERTR